MILQKEFVLYEGTGDKPFNHYNIPIPVLTFLLNFLNPTISNTLVFDYLNSHICCLIELVVVLLVIYLESYVCSF